MNLKNNGHSIISQAVYYKKQLFNLFLCCKWLQMQALQGSV